MIMVLVKQAPPANNKPPFHQTPAQSQDYNERQKLVDTKVNAKSSHGSRDVVTYNPCIESAAAWQIKNFSSTRQVDKLTGHLVINCLGQDMPIRVILT